MQVDTSKTSAVFNIFMSPDGRARGMTRPAVGAVRPYATREWRPRLPGTLRIESSTAAGQCLDCRFNEFDDRTNETGANGLLDGPFVAWV